jgi:hypothetical protein
MCNEVKRMVVKLTDQAGVVPTVPGTDNHQDGSWLATDIYKGEFFFNQADGIMYTRDDSGIVQVQITSSGTGEYIAIATQSGTSAPTVNVIKDTIGGITWSYSSTGVYLATATAGSLFTAGNYAAFVGSFDSGLDRGLIFRNADNSMRVETYVSGVATNAVLLDTLIHIHVILP